MAEPPLRDRPLDTPKSYEAGRTADDRADKPDRHGEWLADDARIWRVYGQLAKEDDKEKAQRWNGGLNNLAIFAALFSGITTSFIIESQNDLKPDFAELAYRVQNATAHGRPYVEEPFIVPGQARLVNCLWITSLLLSLSAALIAIMGQDWVEMYLDKPVCNPRQWAEIRSFRLNGVRRWYMPGVIATAPVLLHAALFLFGIGLAVFMASDVITRNLCIALCAIVAFLYGITMFSPVFWSSSPFRSPATMLVRRWFCASFQRKGDHDGSLPENAALRYIARGVTAVRRWIQNRLSMHWAAFDIALEIYGPHVSSACTAVFRRWFRRQDINDRGSLPHSGATHDRVTPAAISGAQHTAPVWLLNFLSKFQNTFNPILARWGPSLSHGWAVLQQWFYIAFRHGHHVLHWIQDCYRRLRTAFSSILDITRPDFSNGSSDISETPLLGLVADSLSWLSSASSSPEITQLVVTGLCDHVIGCPVSEHANAQSLTQKLCQYADGHWDHLSILDLSRYVIIHANTGRRNWPDRVKQRFKEVIDTEIDISQDFLLAVVHLTSGLRSEPLNLKSSFFNPIGHRIATFERLCAHIPDRSPITLSTITSTISRLRSNDWDYDVAATLSVLMNKWRYVLPLDLRPVEHALRAEKKTNKFCHCVDRPIDNILHFWIESFRRFAGEGTVSRSIQDLALSVARTASVSGINHTCLAAMFGDIDPDITKAAWSDLSAHDILWVLDQTCSNISSDRCHTDLRPVLARMIARCIRPPFPLRTGSISTQVFLSYGLLLHRLVELMSKEGALPDDLFCPVLEVGALANLSPFRHEASRTRYHGGQFLYFLAAVAVWIKERSDGKERLELFELFTAHTSRTSESAVWNLVHALGSTLAIPKDDNLLEVFFFLPGLEAFMLALKALREMFPEPKYTLWAEISSISGTYKEDFPERRWQGIREAIEDGIGINPDQFATETLSLGAGVAVQGDESAPGGSTGTIAPTSVVTVAGTGTLAHPAPQIAWIAAGATPDDAI